MSEKGFVKAASNNLPAIDIFMISDFLKKDDRFNIGEIRGTKAASAVRESYGDSAIGYVQLKREGVICTVKAKICPEHKVRSKAYSVTLEVNEQEEKIMDINCHDCAAAAGGCKHALAFLMWVHRRTEDPAPTEIASYWQKPRLAGVGTLTKFITVREFSTKESDVAASNFPDNELFMKELIEAAKREKIDSQVSRYNFETKANEYDKLSVHKLLHSFKNDGGIYCRDFIQFMSSKMSEILIKKGEAATKDQSKSSLWYEIRYGRITASKLYEAAHCQKVEGTLIDSIIGAHKMKATRAMVRGIRLEKEVLAVIQEKLNKKIYQCGIILKREYPIFGASPDGITDEFVVEIKCPTSEKAMSNYIRNENITNKYKAQIHLQMFAAKKQKALFCVADPNFENTRNVKFVWVDFDENFLSELLEKAQNFWKNCIYNVLFKTV